MLQELLFGVLGGLGLFIFGINIMSDGLQKAAGEKMRDIIRFLTNNRFKGMFLGATITSIIQSSSATTVMVVGFVNAGLMTLLQAVPIILGANIGTTITAQLIAFKLTDYALPVIAIGSYLYMFSKKRIYKQIGEAVLGFGILFLGLNIMANSIWPVAGKMLLILKMLQSVLQTLSGTSGPGIPKKVTRPLPGDIPHKVATVLTVFSMISSSFPTAEWSLVESLRTLVTFTVIPITV